MLLTDFWQKKSIKLLLAYLATYLIWGSTAFAISKVVKHIPPLHSSGFRYFLAGLIMVFWCSVKQHPLPKGKEWGNTLTMTVFLLSISNACTSWACKYVPSSLVVVIQSVIPLIMIVLDSFFFRQENHSLFHYLCVLAGILGVAMIIFSRDLSGIKFVANSLIIFVMMVGAFSWALGSMLIKVLTKPKSNAFSSGIAMLLSSPLQITAGVVIGEKMPLLSTVPLMAFGGLIYLVFMGSIIAFCSYSWLASVEPPSRLGSILFVNPLVALFLGITFGSENLNFQSGVGTIILIFITLLLWIDKIIKRSEGSEGRTIEC